MEAFRELFVLAGRIVTILPLMLLVTLIMGKRTIAELPVFDFLIIVISSAVVGADIADPEIKHIHTAAAMILIGIFHIIISKMLREKDVFDINDVHIGIIESNGNLSVLKKPNKNEITIEDLNLKKETLSLSYPIIIERLRP